MLNDELKKRILIIQKDLKNKNKNNEDQNKIQNKFIFNLRVKLKKKNINLVTHKQKIKKNEDQN
jgi:hypothetical protein